MAPTTPQRQHCRKACGAPTSAGPSPAGPGLGSPWTGQWGSAEECQLSQLVSTGLQQKGLVLAMAGAPAGKV